MLATEKAQDTPSPKPQSLERGDSRKGKPKKEKPKKNYPKATDRDFVICVSFSLKINGNSTYFQDAVFTL
jgi:hypothetical protein